METVKKLVPESTVKADKLKLTLKRCPPRRALKPSKGNQTRLSEGMLLDLVHNATL